MHRARVRPAAHLDLILRIVDSGVPHGVERDNTRDQSERRERSTVWSSQHRHYTSIRVVLRAPEASLHCHTPQQTASTSAMASLQVVTEAVQGEKVIMDEEVAKVGMWLCLATQKVSLRRPAQATANPYNAAAAPVASAAATPSLVSAANSRACCFTAEVNGVSTAASGKDAAAGTCVWVTVLLSSP